MTNAEFYKDKITKFAFSPHKLAVNKNTLRLCSCTTLYCDDCLFKSKCNIEAFLEWCNSEYAFPIDPCITKSTPIDTKVLVSEDGKIWYKRHFAKIENDRVYAWEDGTTSFTTKAGKVCSWTYAKLYEE